MKKLMTIFGAILFASIVITSCDQIKSEEDKIKNVLIGEFKIDDYVNNESGLFKNHFGERVNNTIYNFWKDGKFEYSANLDEVIFYDIMYEEEMLDERINVKFIITGNWEIKDNILNLKYNYENLKFLRQDEDGKYSNDIFFYRQFENKMRANAENKMKIIDYDALKITVENSSGERQTLKKLN
jgi:hypothetical protein